MPDGRVGFTRNGAFGRNAEGLLTTASGYVIQPEIAIPDVQQYHDPLSPPTWLVHKDLEPPGLPQTPPPPPPEMPPPLYEGV